MALLHSFEKSGNLLFKYRGQIPTVLFLLAIPVVYTTDTSWLSPWQLTAGLYKAIIVSTIGLIIRCIAIGTTPAHTSGRNTKEQVAETVNTKGIYSIMRHPLYVGNYLMWIGIVIFTYNVWFVLLVSLGFWLYYERIMFAEERFLENKFGQIYLDWSLRVPAFIPNFKLYEKSTLPFSFKSVLRREYSGISATVMGFMFIDVLRYYFTHGTLCWMRVSVYCFIASLVLVLILRTLKHHTNLLAEEGRS